MADGASLADLPLGERAWVTLVVRVEDVVFLLGVDEESALADSFAGAC